MQFLVLSAILSANESLPGLSGGSMGVSEIIASIDREIAQLRRARALLGGTVAALPKKKQGNLVARKTGKRTKRTLSPEGRRRIAEAQKKRWAAQKKAAAIAQK
ncbi:MAG TPA: hypothetical protein VHD85_21500 [Terracidiphilus sp.]|nr:hypothetical protein [Terracidiphilus sp.]